MTTHLHITLASAVPSSALDWRLASRVMIAVAEQYRDAAVRVDVANVPRDRYTMRVAGRSVEAPRESLEAIVAQTAATLAGELDAAEGWT